MQKKLFLKGGVIALVLAVSTLGISAAALADTFNIHITNSNLANGFNNAFANAYDKVAVRGIPVDRLPSTLSIAPNGHVRLTGGDVAAASTSSLTVSVWGLNFTVTPANADLQGENEQPMNFSDIKVGDTISVSGMLNPSTETISANEIFDYTFVTPPVPQPSPLQGKYNQLLQLLQQLSAQLSQMQVEITSTAASVASASSTSSPQSGSTSTSNTSSTSSSTPSSSSTSTSTSSPSNSSTSSSSSVSAGASSTASVTQ